MSEMQERLRELEAAARAPYLHVVIVRMKENTTPRQLQALLDDVPALLRKIPSVRGLWYGPRARQASPDFAVRDFDVSLAILFDDYHGLIEYLDHPLHAEFLNRHLPAIEAPLVYDAMLERQ